MAEYIDREALCYQLAKQATIDGQPRAIKRAAKIVAEFPAADVRPVVPGKWDMYQDGSGVCSVCGEAQFQHWEDGKPDKFCHNCGADMREES